MLRELLYLTVGAAKRMEKIVDSFIEEGRKELDDKGLIEIGKEHLEKRKEEFKGMVLEDFKKVANELGLATKEDIEQLKAMIKSSS